MQSSDLHRAVQDFCEIDYAGKSGAEFPQSRQTFSRRRHFSFAIGGKVSERSGLNMRSNRKITRAKLRVLAMKNVRLSTIRFRPKSPGSQSRKRCKNDCIE